MCCATDYESKGGEKMSYLTSLLIGVAASLIADAIKDWWKNRKKKK